MSSDLLNAAKNWVFFLGRALVFIWEIVAAAIGLRVFSPSSVLRQKMSEATTYDEWRVSARQLDEHNGFLPWRVDESSRHFNFHDVSQRIKQLSEAKRSGSGERILGLLEDCVHRSTLGITNPHLYSYLTGTKTAIRSYVSLLEFIIRDLPGDASITDSQKREVLEEMDHIYGHTALMLNGSVMLGGYHLGIVKGLHEANLMPRIIFGSNTGAIVAAYLCCMNDINSILTSSAVDFSAFQKRSPSGSVKRKFDRLIRDGVLMDTETLAAFVQDNIGDVTFAEAYKRTGRVLNIHVSRYLGRQEGFASWLLNHLTAPNVLVSSAAVASCATVGVYSASPLMAKTLSGDVVPFDPSALNFAVDMTSFHINDAVKRMREMFNVRHFIVSECSISQIPLFRMAHRRDAVSRALHFINEEFWRCLAFLSRIPFLRSRLTGSLQVMSVQVTGDVVIYPASRVSDLLKLIKNPDAALLEHCLRRGQSELWPRLELIRSHVAIELAIRDALVELTASS